MRRFQVNKFLTRLLKKKSASMVVVKGRRRIGKSRLIFEFSRKISKSFTKGGVLVGEFDRIFSDLFSKRSHRYKLILKKLVKGSADFEQICASIGMEKGGTISQYLDDLMETGYVARDYTWNIKNGEESALSKFRLKDNYLRFYLKYIEPIRHQIEKNRVKIPPAWSWCENCCFRERVFQQYYRFFSTS